MSERLEAMRRSPRGNWAISDVCSVCEDHGISCKPPSGGGSHYKVSHPSQGRILTVPFKRPIKPVYIRKLVAFVDDVVEAGR
jgi:hypothetical protein